ncbi:MAG TPA: acyl-CoA dehydrogenase family protein, partial [Thermoanaerobaculia bacterium]|nr:acyl-CoA dehydrogenase family protein [Thermoanaerobaculia bacterium]
MDIDSLFSEEELMVRQTVRDFVDEEVIPIIEEANRKEEMPMHL